jgi:hypothetical protein
MIFFQNYKRDSNLLRILNYYAITKQIIYNVGRNTTPTLSFAWSVQMVPQICGALEKINASINSIKSTYQSNMPTPPLFGKHSAGVGRKWHAAITI